MRKQDLAPVSAGTFYEGMYINSEIYFKYKNNYILLCRDVLLNSELIYKLRQTELVSETLYIDKHCLSDVLEQSEYFKDIQQHDEPAQPLKELPAEESIPVADHLSDLQGKLKIQEDFQDLTQQTASVMDQVALYDRIEPQVSDGLTKTMSERLEMTDPSVLIQCINNLRKMDDYMYTHSTNVAMLNGLMARWMGLSQEEVDTLIKTGLLHDMGKLHIPSRILNKPSRLTQEEYAIIKRHPQESYNIIYESGERDERVLRGVYEHHERVNGTGYPQGLKSDEISLFARITAVSDVYDAMVAKRPYKDRNSPFQILAEFATSRFSDLDIAIVDVFLKNMPQELLDKRVVLSDGRTAKVVYINPSNFAYPLVRIGKKLIATNPNLRCVAMDNFLSILN